jgi:hypothetical protein
MPTTVTSESMNLNQVFMKQLNAGAWPLDTSIPNNQYYGWHIGGNGLASVDRITYATDTNTASVRGNLSAIKYKCAAT